jgi:hypothetical protein
MFPAKYFANLNIWEEGKRAPQSKFTSISHFEALFTETSYESEAKLPSLQALPNNKKTIILTL